MPPPEHVHVSTSGHIGGHKIVAQLGPVEIELFDYLKRVDPGSVPKTKLRQTLAMIWGVSWRSDAQAIDAISHVVRERGGNGLTHLQRDRVKVAGMAVKCEPEVAR